MSEFPDGIKNGFEVVQSLSVEDQQNLAQLREDAAHANRMMSTLRAELAQAMGDLAELQDELSALRARPARRIIRKTENGTKNGNSNHAKDCFSGCATTQGPHPDGSYDALFDDDLPF